MRFRRIGVAPGIIAVASGYHDIVVSRSAEKMTDVDVETTTDALAAAADREWKV